MINENAAHRLRRRAEEVASILPGCFAAPGQAQPGFVDQGSGLKCVAWRLLRHLGGGHLPQFFVNEREQFSSSQAVALLGALKYTCDIPHAAHNTNRLPDLK